MATEHFGYCSSELTLHEMRIIALHCQGLNRREIAERMGNSPNTLNNQMTKIFLKVGRTSDKALVGQAMLNGFDEQGHYWGRDLFEDAQPAEEQPA